MATAAAPRLELSLTKVGPKYTEALLTSWPGGHPGYADCTRGAGTSFDLGETQTVVLGASAALDQANSGPSARTQVYRVDGLLEWKRADAEGWLFRSCRYGN